MFNTVVSEPNSKELLPILIIFSVALIFRMFYLIDYMSTEVYPVMHGSDGYCYYIWAKDIASGQILGGDKAFMKWPLYAYFLAFLLKIFRENLSFVYLFQFLLGAINCVLIYFIGRRIFNWTIAFLAGLLCAFYGLFIFYDGLLIYTGLSLFLNSLLFLFLLYIQDKFSKKNLFLAGIFLGFCTLAQPNIVIFGILAVAYILWRNKLVWKKLVYDFLCFLAGLFLIIGAVSLRNYIVEKDFVLIAGHTGLNSYLGNNPEAQGIFSNQFFTSNQESMFRESKAIAKITLGRELKTSEVSNFWFNKSKDFIRKNPHAYIKLLLKKIKYLFNPEEVVHDQEYHFIDKIKILKVLFLNLKFILPFALLGIFLNLNKFKESALLYIFLMTLSFSITLFFIASRYRVILVPFLIIFASSGIIRCWGALSNRKYLKFGVLFITTTLLFIFLNYNIAKKSKLKYLMGSTEDLQYHFRKAVIYEGKAKYEEALESLKIADSIQPGNRNVIFSFGSIYYHMLDFKNAEEGFKEAIKIFPFYIEAYYNLGLLYNQEGRTPEAIVVLQQAVFLDPEDAGGHFELGKSYKAKGDLEAAKREFTLALKKINPWRKADRGLIIKELAGLNR